MTSLKTSNQSEMVIETALSEMSIMLHKSKLSHMLAWRVHL